MKKSLCIIGLMLMLASSMPAVAQQPGEAAASSSSATVNDSSSCLGQTYSALDHERRLFRTELFGKKQAKDAPKAEVRYDTKGNAWIKTGDNAWKSLAKGFERTTWSNQLMDQQTEKDALWETPFRFGIFETKYALTSEVLPNVIESMRTLDCRLQSVCVVAQNSQGKTPKNPVEGQIDGCLPVKNLKYAPFLACSFEGQSTNENVPSVVTSCQEAARTILEREMDLTKLAVSYDAAYRSLALQLRGSLDTFADNFSPDLLTPLRQSVSVLSQLGRIPCFLAQCNE